MRAILLRNAQKYKWRAQNAAIPAGNLGSLIENKFHNFRLVNFRHLEDEGRGLNYLNVKLI